MFYTMQNISPKPSMLAEYDHRTIPTPKWFQPFWDVLLKPENIIASDEFKITYHWCLEDAYQQLCGLFNQAPSEASTPQVFH